jgi:hypothetical protein
MGPYHAPGTPSSSRPSLSETAEELETTQLSRRGWEEGPSDTSSWQRSRLTPQEPDVDLLLSGFDIIQVPLRPF